MGQSLHPLPSGFFPYDKHHGGHCTVILCAVIIAKDAPNTESGILKKGCQFPQCKKPQAITRFCYPATDIEECPVKKDFPLRIVVPEFVNQEIPAALDSLRRCAHHLDNRLFIGDFDEKLPAGSKDAGDLP
jgi:hypothetical protein